MQSKKGVIILTDYVDGVPKSEMASFREDHRTQPLDAGARKCEYCDKELTGAVINHTLNLTERVGYKRYETKTIYYCSDCKAKNNM